MSKIKKIVICAILIFIILALAGCKKVTDPYGIERNMASEFIKVKNLSQIGSGKASIYYDPETMICYMQITSLYSLCLTPYYVLGENDKPEIAVYGVNYKMAK